jgi:hypothetical protein
MEYKQAVPRLLPRLRTTLKPTGRKPMWLHALAAEMYPIGVLFVLAVMSWSYDNWLMVRAIIVSFGLSLVTRALTMGSRQKAD